MSFEPAEPISVVTCEHCQGSGCSQCDQLGVYGLQDEQPIAFQLPDFIDLKARRFLKRVYLVKKLTLLITAGLIIIFSWTLLT